MLAVTVSTVADLYLSAANKGILTGLGEGQRLAILLAVGAVICLNIVAFFLTHITEPERLRTMATESAKDAIYAATLRGIQAATPHVANTVAPELTKQWVEATVKELLPESGKPAILAPVTVKPEESEAAKNGTGTFPHQA